MASTKSSYDEFYNKRVYGDLPSFDPRDPYGMNFKFDPNEIKTSIHDFFDPHHSTLMENFQLIKQCRGVDIPRGRGKTTTKLHMCLWEIERELENHPNVSLSISFFVDNQQQSDMTLKHFVRLLDHNKITKYHESGYTNWGIRVSAPNIQYATSDRNKISISFFSIKSINNLTYNNQYGDSIDVISRIRMINDQRHKRSVIFDDTSDNIVLHTYRVVPGITENIKIYG